MSLAKRFVGAGKAGISPASTELNQTVKDPTVIEATGAGLPRTEAGCCKSASLPLLLPAASYPVNEEAR